MKKVNLNLGTGDVGGGSHDRPDVRRFVNAAATFLAGGLKGDIFDSYRKFCHSYFNKKT